MDGREYAPSLFTHVLEKNMVETVVIPRDLIDSNEDRAVHCSRSNGAQSRKRWWMKWSEVKNISISLSIEALDMVLIYNILLDQIEVFM